MSHSSASVQPAREEERWKGEGHGQEAEADCVFLARGRVVTARTSPSLERHRAQRVGLGRHSVRSRSRSPRSRAVRATLTRVTRGPSHYEFVSLLSSAERADLASRQFF